MRSGDTKVIVASCEVKVKMFEFETDNVSILASQLLRTSEEKKVFT